MANMKNLGKGAARFVKQRMMYFVLIVLILIFSTQSKNFLSVNNLINVVNQAAYLIVVGVGISFIMLSGALDLSIGFQMATAAVVMGILARDGYPTYLIIPAGIALAVLMSFINGFIYAKLKVFPFIITLATQYVFYGAAFLLSGSKTFNAFDGAFKWIGSSKIALGSLGVGLPVGILFMIVFVLIGAFILNKTYFGRNIYGLGSNPEAVALSGVSVAKLRVQVFTLAGLFIGIGVVMLSGRVGSTSGNTGVGAEFTVMAGAMLGGIKMGGGGGRMSNMVVGVLILQVLQNGMNMMQLNNFWQKVAMGVILLIAITVDTVQSELTVRRAKLVAMEESAGGPERSRVTTDQEVCCHERAQDE